MISSWNSGQAAETKDFAEVDAIFKDLNEVENLEEKPKKEEESEEKPKEEPKEEPKKESKEKKTPAPSKDEPKG